MKKYLIKWFVILLCCFVISTFVHELGHGISSYAVGVHLSTGFNRVGNVYKAPHDLDFRKGFENFQTPWDMGPATSLFLAVGFTVVFTKLKSKNKTVTMTVGALALCNSLIRLIPMIHSYSGLLIRGNFFVEDEIDLGVLWDKLSGLVIMKYAPSFISIVVSLLCLYFVVKTIKKKLPYLFHKHFIFSASIVLAYIISFIIENKLDNIIRINWI